MRRIVKKNSSQPKIVKSVMQYVHEPLWDQCVRAGWKGRKCGRYA